MARGRTRILLVDDEVDLSEALAAYLERHGHETCCVPDGGAMRAQVDLFRPDAVVLDLQLGRESGLDLASWLTGRDDPAAAPAILFLSGSAEPVDKVLGLELGGDDFVEKPVPPRELLARINALLRRRGRLARASRLMPFGAVAIDLAAQSVIAPDGTETLLAPGEFALLKCFVDEPDRLFSRDELLDRAPASDEDVADRAIDRRIARLRRKLEPDGAAVAIETVRGHGYRLSRTPEHRSD